MGFGGNQSEPGQITEINDINITPFVDVVLVLLVIFMVTAPMLMKDLINLKLPKTTTADAQSLTSLAVAVTEGGQILLNGELLTRDSLFERAKLAAEKDENTQVIISADLNAKHGDVVTVIDAVKTAGLENFAIQVEKK